MAALRLRAAPAQVAGGAGVELAHHGAGQLQGLAGQLHHLKGGLGAALQGLLHGGLAGGLLLVGVLGHGEHGADGVERLGIPVDHVHELSLELVPLLLGLDGQLLHVGVLLLSHGEGAHHSGEGGAQGALQRGGRSRRPGAGSSEAIRSTNSLTFISTSFITVDSPFVRTAYSMPIRWYSMI